MNDQELRRLVAEVTRGSRINARLTWAVVSLAVVVAVLSAGDGCHRLLEITLNPTR